LSRFQKTRKSDKESQQTGRALKQVTAGYPWSETEQSSKSLYALCTALQIC